MPLAIHIVHLTFVTRKKKKKQYRASYIAKNWDMKLNVKKKEKKKNTTLSDLREKITWFKEYTIAHA